MILDKRSISVVLRTIALFTALILSGTLNAQAVNGNWRNNVSRVSLTAKVIPVHEAVESVASQAGLAVGWSKDIVKVDSMVSLNIQDMPLSKALELILRGTEAEAALSSDGKTIVLTRKRDKKAAVDTLEAGQVTGRIVDSLSGKGLEGASISIVGTAKYNTLADNKGSFILNNVVPGDYVVSIKMLGYSSVTRTVRVAPAGRANIHVNLHPTTTQLSGVVTTAVGQQRRLEVGNDITVIKVDSVIRNTPVSTLSDLLSTRIPGLYAAPSSGEPGAPVRIRIRGVSSINSSNDPIVIVDGVQVYSRMVEPPRLTGDPLPTVASVANKSNTLVQSPLDQIDPSTIEVVEVLKGPSAVALYGSDAANGVIVVTTKRGTSGPMRWNIMTDFKSQFMPGKWPLNYWAWGRQNINENELYHCTIEHRDRTCTVDSLITYQILNDPHTTTLGRGFSQSYSATLSGGSNSVTYSLTGNTSRELGLMKLPDADVSLLEISGNKLSSLTKRPQRNERQGGTGRVDITFGKSIVTFTTTLARQLTRGSPLSDAISQSSQFKPAQDQYNSDGDLLIRGSGLIEAIPDFRRTRASRTIRSLSSINISTSWSDKLRTEATAGIDLGNTYDNSLLKNGECSVITNLCNGTGQFSNAHGTNIQSNINLRASLPLSLNRFTTVTVNSGANLVKTTTNKISTFHEGLPVGGTSGLGAAESYQSDVSSEVATAGVYLGTTLGLFNRFYLPLEIRKDAGSALGSKVAPTFPRLSMSYIISDEPLFSNSSLANFISTLRLRVAYGQAGKQPRAGDAIRTYITQSTLVDGIQRNLIGIDQVGNAMLQPERTKEIELGVDMEAFDGRLSVSPTIYRKNTKDLLVSELLPLSVGGLNSYKRNLGDVRNSGWDITVNIVPIESQSLIWSSQFGISGSKNVVTRLNRAPAGLTGGGGLNVSSLAIVTRNIVGFPLNGNWALPIVGYADKNGDGKILRDDVLLGDSAIYIGAPYPKFIANVHQSMTVLGQFTLNAVVEYKSGLNQTRGNRSTFDLDRASNDPTVSLGEQAYQLYSALARVQTVSSTQLSSVSLGWIVPQHIRSRILSGRRNIQINLRGTNLGLWTNYRGKDPNVGATGERVEDIGSLPTPRTYGISIRIS